MCIFEYFLGKRNFFTHGSPTLFDLDNSNYDLFTLQVDKKYAIQLENTIGLENLEAFVCVSREDTNKLINCLR